MVCFNRSYYIISIFNFFFQGCLPQILLGPLLNTSFIYCFLVQILRGVFRSLPNICDGAFLREQLTVLFAISAKKHHHRCLTGSGPRFWVMEHVFCLEITASCLHGSDIGLALFIMFIRDCFVSSEYLGIFSGAFKSTKFNFLSRSLTMYTIWEKI